MVAVASDYGGADESLAGLYASSEEKGECRARSVNLFADPKMRELKHYAKSHSHEQRLRANAEIECRPRKGGQLTEAEAEATALRLDGCEMVNLHMKRLAAAKEATPPRTRGGGGGSSPSSDTLRDEEDVCDMDLLGPESREALLRRMNRFHTRLQWRDHMDQSLSRLMADIELARDERLKEYAHKARCGHLDKIYDWYLTHGMKEARKERAAPPYVRFSVDGPVMPGSMRVAPKSRENAGTPVGFVTSTSTARRGSTSAGGDASSSSSSPAAMGHSVSLPNLAGTGRTPQAGPRMVFQ